MSAASNPEAWISREDFVAFGQRVRRKFPLAHVTLTDCDLRVRLGDRYACMARFNRNVVDQSVRLADFEKYCAGALSHD